MKKRLITFLLTVFLPILSMSILGQSAFAQQGQDNVLWIDVRTQTEWDAGHVTGAILIPYDTITKKISTVTKDKKQRINLYCKSGNRAAIALKALENLGYSNVQNVGGFSAVKASGVPTIQKK